MRHQHKGFKLGRTSAHRKATMASMSVALIKHKRITTTVTKAKALRVFVEPIINKAKEDSTHNRRQAFRYLRDKYAVTELFENVSSKITDRPGGYCRIIKLGQRAGDSAEMAMIELVDYNDVRPEGAAGGRTRKTRRAGRRRSSGSGAASDVAPVEAASESVAEGVVESVEEAVESAEEVVETVSESVEEAVDTVADTVAEVVEDTAETVVDAVEDVAEKAAGIDADEQEADSKEEPEAKSENDVEADPDKEKGK